MDPASEQVLVVPTRLFHDLGVFQGFCSDIERYLPALLDRKNQSFRPRSEVEEDPSFKQLIPYVVLRCRDQVFHYTRGKRATETRLQALRSIGVGGHISRHDEALFDSSYREAMFREVTEEVLLETSYEEHCLGLINDDSTPVGQVHLGIVHIFELAEPKARRREQALIQSGFAPLTQLFEEWHQFESWSQLVMKWLLNDA
jgi:predicted NUDIX family phosphoesterase